MTGKSPPSETQAMSELRLGRRHLHELMMAKLPEDTRPSKTSSSMPRKTPEDYAFSAMRMAETAFFTFEESPEKVIEVAFPAMDNPSRLKAYLKNPEMFVVTSLRKKRVEINEKKLTPEEREMIRFAKGKEVKEFVKEQVVIRLLAGEHVDAEDVMKMRFVLTWKADPDSPAGKKGKARLVVLGFQDPYLGKETTCSPTLNKRSKQMLLQMVVQKGWRLKKGDVTAAFLQGRPLSGKNKYALAPPELAEAMGLPPGERVVRLLKSVYGLTTAGGAANYGGCCCYDAASGLRTLVEFTGKTGGAPGAGLADLGAGNFAVGGVVAAGPNLLYGVAPAGGPGGGGVAFRLTLGSAQSPFSQWRQSFAGDAAAPCWPIRMRMEFRC